MWTLTLLPHAAMMQMTLSAMVAAAGILSVGAVSGWSGPEACSPGTNGTAFKFCDHTLPMSTRLDDLVQRVEVDEIASELTGPSSPKPNPFASRSVLCTLLTSTVSPGSRYRHGQST